MAGELLEFTSSETGEVVAGQVLNLEQDNVGAVLFGLHMAVSQIFPADIHLLPLCQV